MDRSNQVPLDVTQGTWHLIGIGGIGVSAVARVLHARGCRVQGSDVRASQLTHALEALGIQVHIGHNASHLDGVDTVVVSTAIPATNPELVAARERDLPIVHRSRVLAALLEDRHAIGVIGTHGKGTVSAAITWLLEADGRAPGYMIGGLLENFGDNSRDGDGWFVAEVDESDGSLVNVHPEVAVLNNLELDHLNYYPDWETLQAAVCAFFLDNPRLRLAILNADDAGVRRILPHLAPLAERGVRMLTFGFEQPADVRGEDLQARRMSGSFAVTRGGAAALGRVEVALPGAYNAANVLAAIATCDALGVPFATMAAALPVFTGLENRFTLVDAAGIEVVKDYISHPTGILRVLEAARAQAEGEVVAVFKPYRFTMIHYLQDDYARAFQDADRVIVTELYTAGEVPIPGVNVDLLCRRIRESCARVEYVAALDAIPPLLEDSVAAPATVLFFGGDDLFQVADSYARDRLAAAN